MTIVSWAHPFPCTICPIVQLSNVFWWIRNGYGMVWNEIFCLSCSLIFSFFGFEHDPNLILCYFSCRWHRFTKPIPFLFPFSWVLMLIECIDFACLTKVKIKRKVSYRRHNALSFEKPKEKERKKKQTSRTWGGGEDIVTIDNFYQTIAKRNGWNGILMELLSILGPLNSVSWHCLRYWYGYGYGYGYGYMYLIQERGREGENSLTLVTHRALYTNFTESELWAVRWLLYLALNKSEFAGLLST